MSKRTSGLGRGLGDLLADNAPEVGGGATVVWRDEGGEVVVTPDEADAVNIAELEADAAVTSEVAEPSLGGARGGEVLTDERPSADECSATARATDDEAALPPQATEKITAGEQLAAPLVFPVYGENADDRAKNVEAGDDIGQNSTETATNDAPRVEHHPHRSLKALFKSYK